MLLHAAALLEGKRHAFPATLPKGLFHSMPLHGPGSPARFATHNHPMYFAQRQGWNCSRQRFDGKKAHQRGNSPQQFRSIGVLLAFYADAHPNICRPFQIWRQFNQALGSLSPDLTLMLRTLCHRGEDPPDIELTNNVRGLRQRLGRSTRSGCTRTSNLSA